MRCFFYEAMNHFGYVPSTCIIDNTNLAVLPGTSGRDAIFIPEMAALAKMFGFTWMAHEIKHSDRKAGVERAFWTIETNFFPGREFVSLEDLNKQARDWTSRHDCTPNKKTKLVPLEQFEHERHEMIRVSSHLPRPYKQHRRVVDQYGYIVFDSNN